MPAAVSLASAHKCHTFAGDKLVVPDAKSPHIVAAVKLKFSSWLNALASLNMYDMSVTLDVSKSSG